MIFQWIGDLKTTSKAQADRRSWAYCVEKVGRGHAGSDFQQQRFKKAKWFELFLRFAVSLSSNVAGENRWRSFTTQ
jgi:hypothetical protein